jgi:hypothetical protein
VTVDAQPLEVLLGDLLVRAHIDHVDPTHAARSEVLDRALDHTPSHHRLAQPDFVGDQEAARALFEHPRGDVVHGALLKVLEARHRRLSS